MSEYYQNMELKDAIKNASIGDSYLNKMDPHQRRVGKVTGGKGAEELLKYKEELKKVILLMIFF